MFFEFQLSIASLGATVRNQLHNLKLCFADSFPFQGDKLLVNRILVQSTTSLQRRPSSFTIQTSTGAVTVAGSKCVLIQPLQLEIVSEQQAIASGSSPAPIKMSPIINMQLGVTAFVSESEAFLQFAFDGIDFGIFDAVIDDQTKQMIVDAVQANFGTIKRKVDMVALQAFTQGVSLTVTNAGATTTSAGDVFILRIEINGAANQEAHWTEFYNSYNTNLVGARNWALLIDKNLLIAAINAKLGSSLAAGAERFSLDSGPSTSWNQGLPGFNVSFSGEVIDACTCFWGEIDLDADVESDIKLSVPSKNVLRTRIYTTYDASNLEVFCCALTAGLFWPVVGLIYLGKEEINFGEYLLGWLGGPIIVFIAVCVIAGNQSIAGQVGNLQGQCKKVNDETVECDQNVSLSFGAIGGTYALDAITGRSQGPVLSGAMTVQALNDPKLEVGSVNEFSWTLQGSCSKGFGSAVTGGLAFYNTVPGSVLKVCDLKVLEDPANAFQNIKLDSYSITINPVLSPEYLAAPYPCRLRLTTNGGVRIITLDPAKDISPEESQKIMVLAGIAKANCLVPVKKFPPDEITFLRWLPDPPPDAQVHRLWHIVISEMVSAEQFEILDARSNRLATATASERGVAYATVLQEQPSPTELGLRFVVSRQRGKAEEEKRHLSIRQVELLLAARFWVSSEFTELEFEQTGEQMLLHLRASSAETVYDVSVPEAPALTGNYPLQVAPPMSSSAARPSVAPLTDVSRVGSVPRRERLLLSADRMQLMMRLPGGSVEQLPIEALADGPVDRIVPARVPGRKNTVGVVLANGDVRVMDLSDPRHPQEVTYYHGRPWFVDSARSGSLVARRSNDGLWIYLYRFGTTAEPSAESLGADLGEEDRR